MALILKVSPEVNFTVVLRPEQGAGDFADVGHELKSYLERVFGQPVGWEKTGKVPVCLFLDPLAEGGVERFTCTVASDRLELRSRSIQGLRHAVYWFLETYLGVRWLWPGELGEVIPTHQQVSLAEGTVVEEPDFYYRAIHTEGALWKERSNIYACYADVGATPEYFATFDAWGRHNRMGGMKVEDGHRLGQILPPGVYGDEHPEYFALVDGERQTEYVDGKHGNHVCFCNKQAAEVMAEYCIKRLDAGGEVDVFTIAANDGHAICECELCKTFEDELGGQVSAGARHIDNITDETNNTAPLIAATDRMISQANVIAEMVKKKHPNKHILALLYSTYRNPPRKYTLDEYVIGQFCIMGHLFYNDEIRQRELQLLNNMAPAVPRLGIYEYFCNGAWPDLQRMCPVLIGENVKAYHQAGARFFATQAARGFATNGINMYVLAKKLWDVEADTNEIIDDYCRSGFGGAAEHIKRYLCAFEERWKETKSFTTNVNLNRQHLFLDSLYPKAFLDKRRDDLAQARGAVEANCVYAGRIEFLAGALEKLVLFVEAMNLAAGALPLDEKCNLRKIDAKAPYAPVRADVDKALAAIEHFMAESRKDDFQFIHDDCFRYYRQGVDGEKLYVTMWLRQWQETLKGKKL